MSGIVWTKFYWSDWETDPALRLCSFAAQGLWMRMLCIAASHDPIGYVAVAGRGLDETDIARMTGGSESEVRSLLGELDRNGVCSRDRHGRIYSRRMTSDARKSALAVKNGKNGGNPNLSKDKGNSTSDNPQVNLPLKGRDKPHKPYASIKVRAPKSALTLDSGDFAEDRNSIGKKEWAGPADFRAAVVAAKGEDFACSWLDQTAWRDAPAPAVVCHREITARKLKADLRTLLRERGVTVQMEAA